MDLDDDYFEQPNVFVRLAVVTGVFYLMPCVAFFPQWLPPPQIAGFLGNFLLYLSNHYSIHLRNSFIIVLLIHLFEAVTAVLIASYIGLTLSAIAKWFKAVFLYGIFSLKFLLRRLYQVELARQSGKGAKLGVPRELKQE